MNRTVFVLIPIAAILSLLFFFGGPDYYSTRSFKHFWDLGHIIFFAIFSYLILSLWQKLSNQPFRRQCAWILLVTLLLGAIIEIGQSGIGRSPDFGDLMRDVIGTSLILFFWAPSRKIVPKQRLRLFQVVTVTAIMISLVPLAVALTDEWTAEKQFPVLADFENRFETARWTGDADFSTDNKFQSHGKASLKVILNTSLYSGVALKYFPGNWMNYKELQLSIYNPDKKPFQLTCRIHDRQHSLGIQLYEDRFNKSFSISNGWNLITIPLSQIANAPHKRKMALNRIQGLGIFAVSLPKPRTVYIDYVRLVNY